MTATRPSTASRTEGLVDFTADAIVNGARVVHAAHQGVMRRNFWIAKQVPGAAAPVELIETVHDAHLAFVYGAIRGSARALQIVATALLESAADRDAASER